MLLVGDPSVLAVESSITQVYREPGLMALGYFNLHIGGLRYGVFEPDATLLACSFDKVTERVRDRGMHTAPFASQPNANEIADAFRNAIYAEQQRKEYLGMSLEQFSSYFRRDSSDVIWAPDGDQAFDDSSYVLQFDIGDEVRLVSFRGTPDYSYDPHTLRDVWMASDMFYGTLRRWRDAFETEWQSMSKVAD